MSGKWKWFWLRSPLLLSKTILSWTIIPPWSLEKTSPVFLIWSVLSWWSTRPQSLASADTDDHSTQIISTERFLIKFTIGFLAKKSDMSWRRKYFWSNVRKKSKLFKISENGKKSGRNWFLEFWGPPPKKFGGRIKNLGQKWKKWKLFKIA